jgi:hypothetical protein
MGFEIIGEITDTETIAIGKASRELPRLRKQYGSGRGRELKGIAVIRLPSGRVRRAEVHWYEAHGVGRKDEEAETIPGLGQAYWCQFIFGSKNEPTPIALPPIGDRPGRVEIGSAVAGMARPGFDRNWRRHPILTSNPRLVPMPANPRAYSGLVEVTI